MYDPVRRSGKIEADLLAGSQLFQQDFVTHEPGGPWRELVRKPDGTYLDIVQFRSQEEYVDVRTNEMEAHVSLETYQYSSVQQPVARQLLD